MAIRAFASVSMPIMTPPFIRVCDLELSEQFLRASSSPVFHGAFRRAGCAPEVLLLLPAGPETTKATYRSPSLIARCG
jgi:hypothetical protein